MVVEASEQVPEAPSAPATPDEAVARREKSTIEFAYADLDEAVSVAKVVHEHYGQQCTPDQLAAALGHGTTAGGAFRLKVSTARNFGLIESGRQDIILTPLGREVVDPSREASARARAFLNVPLYRRVFEAYRGQLLPRDIALENDMVRWGVALKQKERARQVFQRSAQQAGFFAHGRDRLVAPAGVNIGQAAGTPIGSGNPPAPPPPPPRDDRLGSRGDQFGGDGGGGGGKPELHPAIQGLLVTLPAAGSSWPIEKQEKWVTALKSVLELVYPSD